MCPETLNYIGEKKMLTSQEIGKTNPYSAIAYFFSAVAQSNIRESKNKKSNYIARHMQISPWHYYYFHNPAA